MDLARSIPEVRRQIAAVRRNGARIGLVPTMGALHEGHLSLMETARSHSDYVVVSIFVNPTQFGPNEDLDKYPRDEQRDLELCRAVGAALVFLPTADDMYPPGAETVVHVKGLGDYLCGPARPGHFDGVATIVCKLFNIVQPDVALFGEKDAQQLAILRRMTIDLNLPVDIVGCPTVREPDGLARSSRNVYLTEEQRRRAPGIQNALQAARDEILAGQSATDKIESLLLGHLRAASPDKIDYAQVVDVQTLQPVDKIVRPVLIAVAAWFGSTRLIDNLTVDPLRDNT
ncbi:MAG: pantoate--beta-alanine ligase [Phycisphaerae bacterium]